jgi:transposase
VQPEERLESKRRELFRLVEQEGVPVAEACERLHVASSTYYRYRKRVAEVGGEEGLKSIRPRTGIARASLEEEAAILSLVKAEPLLGAKRVSELLQATGRAGPNLTPATVYLTLRKNGLNTREKRLEFAQNGTDRRMARLARALSTSARADRAPEGQGGGE